MTYALSQTLILPAMPALVRELGASPLAVSWLLTDYLVAASVATPLIGKLGDLYGRGRMLAAVMAVFIAGSIACAPGDSLALLVAGRNLQGAAGGVFPLAYGIIMRTIGMAVGSALSAAILATGGPTLPHRSRLRRRVRGRRCRHGRGGGLCLRPPPRPGRERRAGSRQRLVVTGGGRPAAGAAALPAGVADAGVSRRTAPASIRGRRRVLPPLRGVGQADLPQSLAHWAL